MASPPRTGLRLRQLVDSRFRGNDGCGDAGMTEEIGSVSRSLKARSSTRTWHDTFVTRLQITPSTVHLLPTAVSGFKIALQERADPIRLRGRANFAGWSLRLLGRLWGCLAPRRTILHRPCRRPGVTLSMAWCLLRRAGRSAYRRGPCL